MARALQLRYEGKRELIFIFANTGKERIETLDFINECEIRWNLNCVWLEYDLVDDKSTFKIVDYNTASRNGEPFEKMIAKYGIPNKAFPHCTRELKRQTITRYLRSIGLNNGKYETAIGIRIDEAHRINWQNAKHDRFIYPLATDFRATKDFIRT
jgi:3'-phosphoadenosine 5'-phosphosulfate sulfotransferase (PAPS reductase)/FAD synthetase